ncbi:replication Fork Protection Component Swi3 [Ancylostoma caninum]|uniref:TIMELESS-interacting protein n=1 Tax=Ancylostoma caninum TaxID=29170 RepID=A0A368G9Z3_ANCCA|nr:replication Fork Protection Component Swi3 [Ancylostoma caninum]
MDDFFGNDFYSDEPAIDEEEAGPSDDQQLNSLIEKENQQVVKKSGKSRPQPKLNEATITGPKGIQALRESFKNYKPDPLKDPYENLNVILKKYEHWAHVMFPKLKFEDVVNRCESLGDKRIVKVYMTKSRLDMPITDEDFAPRRRKGDEVRECFPA